MSERGARGLWNHSGSLIEVLEDRRLLSTLDITAGALNYDASNAASDLTISIASAGAESFTDADQTITLTAAAMSAGWSGSGTNTVTGPLSSISSMTVGGTDAGQSLKLDFTNGDPLPNTGLTFDPAAASSQAFNSLTLQSGLGGTTFLSEDYTATSAGAGTITYSDPSQSNVPITFSNLSPVTDTVPAPTFIFTAPATSQTVNFNTGPIVGGVQTDQINDGGTGLFELFNFANKTVATVNVPDSGATTTINYPTAAAGLSTLNVFSGGGGETVNVQTNAAGITTTVDTGSVAGSTINVGLGGSLAAIDGTVFVQSTGGTNTLAINDSGESTPATYTIAGEKVTATSMPGSIDFSGGGLTTLSLTSSGSSTVTLASLVQSDVATYNFIGGAAIGPNTLNLTSPSPTPDYTTTPGVITFGAGNPTVDYTTFATVNITKPAISPTGTAVTITSPEGQALNNVVVATFALDPNDLWNTSFDFVASIDWGDASPVTAGTIVPTGGGDYDIVGSHTYAAAGTFSVAVTLTDFSTSGTTTVAGTTFNVTSNGPVFSTPNPIVSTADIIAAPLTAQGATVSGTEGAPLNGVLVATFMDTGTPGSPADYTASIDWGNGTTTAATSITSQGTANGVVFSIFGSLAGTDTYATFGTYPVTVTVTKTASGATAIALGQAVIADAALTAVPTPALTVHTGTALPAATVVGTFTDTNLKGSASDFTATIDWGDGPVESTGIVVATATPGEYAVEGGHTYDKYGQYNTIIVVKDVGGAEVTLAAALPALPPYGSAQITVSDPPITGSTPEPSPTPSFTSTEGQNSGTVLLAQITDPNPLATAGNITAILNTWGDGTPPPPALTVFLTVVQVSSSPTDTVFDVYGSHTYDEQGAYTYSLTVSTLDPSNLSITLTGTAGVLDASLSSSSGQEIYGIEGATTPVTVPSAVGTLLGSFTDLNQFATIDDFLPISAGGNGGSVVVNWGDGSALQTLGATNLKLNGSPNGVTFTVNVSHDYVEEGTYPYTVTVTDDGGSVTSFTGSAIIADAPLTTTGLTQPTVTQDEPTIFPLPVTSPMLFSGPVAVFHDDNPLPTTGSSSIADFTAIIDWGDGTAPTVGTIVALVGGSASYEVTGSHTYADAGSTGQYKMTALVTDDGGSKLTIANTATVIDNPISVTGSINPASVSGLSTGTPNLSNNTQPDFFGTVFATLPGGAMTHEGFAEVTLTATNLATGVAIPIGSVQADSGGTWNIVSQVALPDGHYMITATAVDQFGQTVTTSPDVINANLQIDTVGPVITSAFFNRLNGQVDFTIQDPGAAPSGVWLNTLLDSSNYLFTKVHANKAYPGKWIVTNVTATPGSAPYSYNVVVTINSGRIIRGGFYLFTIRDSSNGNSSVQDLAENHLDGVFYGSFPSGNGINRSDFVAELDGYHNKIFAPQTIVGTANNANGGVGGAPVGAVHSGDFTPIVRRIGALDPKGGKKSDLIVKRSIKVRTDVSKPAGHTDATATLHDLAIMALVDATKTRTK